MTIHSEHPFAPGPDGGDDARRFRGRLGGAVSLWTSGQDPDPAGLTVSSLMLATGEPAALLALLDPDSDLAHTLLETSRAVVTLLEWPHRGLADAFAYTVPAPGGPWRLGEWSWGAYGPRLTSATTWAEVSLIRHEQVGWSTLVTCSVDRVVVGEGADALLHRRGRYSHS